MTMDVTERRAALQRRRAQLPPEARAALDARMAGKIEVKRPVCLVQLAHGSGTPLFCVHPAGGDVLAYTSLAARLGRPFFGLQTPALGGGPSLRTVTALAEHYVDAVSHVVPSGPLLLAGWSLGGNVVHEMGVQLAARGRPPALLAVLDADPSTEAGPGFPVDSDDPRPWLENIAAYLERVWGQPFGPWDAPETGQDAFDAFLSAAARTAPTFTLSRVQLERVVDVFRGNVQALAAHAPTPYRGTLDLFRCRGDAGEQMVLGWRAIAAEVRDHVLAGDHYTVVAEPHVRGLASALSAAIARSEAT